LFFSWYIIGTSLFVFIIFNIKTSQKYLYDLIGADYVKSKIGNPGAEQLAKVVGPIFGGTLIDEGGRHCAI